MKNVELETYLTVRELADYLRLNVQTIQRWVINREVPFHKIKKVIRFRVSEIEKWVTESGRKQTGVKNENTGGGLFEGVEAGGGL